MKKVLMSVVVLLMLVSNSVFAQVTNGQVAPDFTLTDTNGKQHSLSDYKGKYVVLEWLNVDCPFVKKHYDSGNMQQLQKDYTAKDVVWLSINSSAAGKQGNYPPQELNQILEKNGAAATAVLLDENGQVGHLYDAQTTPHMFVIDPNGNLIYQGAIDDNSSANPEDAKTADNYVKAALDASMNGNAVAVPSTKSYGCSVKY